MRKSLKVKHFPRTETDFFLLISLGERDAPLFLICVRMHRSSNGNGERNVEVCPGVEQAGDEAGKLMSTRDQRREDAHEGDAAAGGGTH